MMRFAKGRDFHRWLIQTVREAVDMLVAGTVRDREGPALHALLRPPQLLRGGGSDGA